MVSGGGLLATTIMIVWPLLTILLFFVMRPAKAALISIFGGLLFLPELVIFRIPMLPSLDKQNIPYLSVLLAFTLRQPGRVWRLPRERWVTLVTVVILLSGFGIGLTNPDGMTVGEWTKVYLPGLTVKDGMYVVLHIIPTIAVPFFLGSVLVQGREDMENFLRFFVKAALLYSLFAVAEMRLSPQFHAWVYGYHQHEFQQSLRAGGYRPTVFMAHGLGVALFFCTAVLASATLYRIDTARFARVKPRTVFIYLAVVLVACKSTGAIIYAVAVLPVLLIGSPKVVQRVATALALIVLLYPSLRGAGLFPTETILSGAKMLGSDREGSLAFRFENEELLTKKARERPTFGWGAGRNLIYGGDGRPATVTDGEWIIVFGTSGFVGFATWFGLLVTPIFLAGRRLKRFAILEEKRLLTSVALMVGVAALDLLPNSLFSNYPFFISGALLSFSRNPTTTDPTPSA